MGGYEPIPLPSCRRHRTNHTLRCRVGPAAAADPPPSAARSSPASPPLVRREGLVCGSQLCSGGWGPAPGQARCLAGALCAALQTCVQRWAALGELGSPACSRRALALPPHCRPLLFPPRPAELLAGTPIKALPNEQQLASPRFDLQVRAPAVAGACMGAARPPRRAQLPHPGPSPHLLRPPPFFRRSCRAPSSRSSSPRPRSPPWTPACGRRPAVRAAAAARPHPGTLRLHAAGGARCHPLPPR